MKRLKEKNGSFSQCGTEQKVNHIHGCLDISSDKSIDIDEFGLSLESMVETLENRPMVEQNIDFVQTGKDFCKKG